MKRFWIGLGCALLMMVVTASPGWTASTDEEGVYKMGEVVVSGDRDGAEVVATTREVTAKQIRANGARTLDEAIALLPGVVVRSGAQGVPRIDIRGFRSRHVILLLNGIPMNSTNDGQFDPSMIAVENIARIKVSYSTHSVLYGDGGLAGVINVVTRKGTRGIQGALKAEAGEGKYYLGSATLSGGSERADFFISGSATDRDAFRLSDDFEPTATEDGDLRNNSDKRRDNLFGNIGFKAGDALQLGATFSYVGAEYGIPPSAIDDNTDIFASRARYDRVDDFNGMSGQLNFDVHPSGPLGVRGWFFANRQDEETNRYDDDTYTTIQNRRSYHQEDTTTVYGGSLQTSCAMASAGSLVLGLNGRQEQLDRTGYILTSNNGATDSLDADHDVDVYSAAVEYSVAPLDKLFLVLGYSHLWQHRPEGDDDDDDSYMLGLSYDMTATTRIKGSAARKVRFPTLRQLYGQDEGNAELSAERSDNYEVGLEQMLPGNSLMTVTGFYIDAEDYIEKITDVFINNDHYRFKGIEATAGTRFVERLNLVLGYTYMETEDKSPDTQKDELQYRPKHKVTLEGDYRFDFGFTVYAAVSHLADQYYYSRDNNAPLEKAKLNDITTVDIKLDQALSGGRLHLFVGADNIFDENYEESYAYPAAGRFIYGGGAYHF